MCARHRYHSQPLHKASTHSQAPMNSSGHKPCNAARKQKLCRAEKMIEPTNPHAHHAEIEYPASKIIKPYDARTLLWEARVLQNIFEAALLRDSAETLRRRSCWTLVQDTLLRHRSEKLPSEYSCKNFWTRDLG